MPRKKGTPWKIDLSTKKFGEWTVLSRVAGSMWLCQCSCGTEHMIAGNTLTLGKSVQCKSCASIKHGMEGTKIYNVWAGMKQRCQNPNYHSFARYGGRGIKVCAEWQEFSAFYADVGDIPRGKSLGRIDNDGDYCPSNVRWETPKQQIRNRSNTKRYEHEGHLVTLGELSDKTGIPVRRFRERIDVHGMTVDEAMRKPYRPKKK